MIPLLKNEKKNIDCNNNINLQSKMNISFIFYALFKFYFLQILPRFFIENYNLLIQKWQFWQPVLNSFEKLVLITIYYTSLFKRIKSGLKRIFAFSCLKIKLQMQFASLILLKLFLVAVLLSFSLIYVDYNKIKAMQLYANPTLLK